MDGHEIQVELTRGGEPETGPGRAGAALARRWRHDYPERELWTCVRPYPDNTFDLSKPGLGTMAKVPGIVPGLWRIIRAGSTVVVGWVQAGLPGRQRPYVKGLGRAKQSPMCEIEGLHLQTGVNEERNYVEPRAGRCPSGVRLDLNWQSDAIGDAKLEYPLTFCTGLLSGRLVGWIAAAWGAAGGNYSRSQNKLVTCVDLTTGETVWSNLVTSLTETNQNFPAIYLEPAAGEIVVASQYVLGVGQVYLERLSACSGESVGASWQVSPTYVPTAQSLQIYADGEFVSGTAAAGATEFRVFKRGRNPRADAYAFAYSLRIPQGGTGSFSSSAGGAAPAAYWPERDQAILQIYQKTGTPIVRARILAWEVRSGRVLWSHDLVELSGLDATSNCQIRACRRDNDGTGAIYVTADLDPPGTDRVSHLYRFSSDGALEWTIELDATSPSGTFWFLQGGGGPWDGGLLAHYDYVSGAGVQYRPVWVPRSGSTVVEGPDDWRLYGVEPCWASRLDGDWVYCFYESISAGTKVRYHLAGPGWESLVSWEQATGLSRDARSTPDAGPVALLDGWIYGVNWDSASGCWRVRRWN